MSTEGHTAGKDRAFAYRRADAIVGETADTVVAAIPLCARHVGVARLSSQWGANS